VHEIQTSPKYVIAPQSLSQIDRFFLCDCDNTNILSPLQTPLTKSLPRMSSTQKKQRSAIADVVAREYTIHLHKRVCFAE